VVGALPWRQGERVRALWTSKDHLRRTECGCCGESREGSGHDGRCSGFGIGKASNRAPEEGSWDSGIAMRWARESSSSAGRRLEPDARCPKSDQEHQRWADHGNGFSSPRGARGSYRRREVLEDVTSRVGTPRVGPLKLATRIPSSRIESAGANRAGSRERPNSPSWCTSSRMRKPLP